MDEKKLAAAIKDFSFHYPDKSVLPNAGHTEIICEVEPAVDHPEFSVAVVELERSDAHHHLKTTETYMVMRGLIRLHIGSRTVQLTRGNEFTIEPGQIHWAEAIPEGALARVKVASKPGWTPEDHIDD